MRFSLMLATLNRSKEIRECLSSLKKQTCNDFEVIVIDQSEDELTKDVVNEFYDLNIQYFKVDFKGLSKARNFGLNYAKGDYCCLLDDDAVYSKQYLSEAKEMIDKYGEIVISGMILSSEDYKTPFVKYKNANNRCKLNVSDILTCCPSAALAFPTSSITKAGYFDERLGVGNKFASGEETDFLLRLYDAGYEIYFCKEMVAFHPIKPVTSLSLIYRHYLGKGALFKIDFCKRKKIRLISLLLKNIVGIWIKAYIFDRNNREIYLMRKKGFIEGVRLFELR